MLRPDTRDPRQQSPFNALPAIVVALAGAMMAIELVFQAGAAGLAGGREAVGWRLAALQDWSVAAPVWDWMLAKRTAPPAEIARFVTYPFLHGDLLQALFVAVFVLAFGNAVAPVYPGWRFLALFFGASVAGALAFVVAFDARLPLFGGFPGAYGLIGAFAFLTRRGLTRAPRDRAFLLLGFLLAIQPAFALLTLSGLSFLPEWAAEIAGAAAGYGLAAAMFPGAFHRFRDRLRQR